LIWNDKIFITLGNYLKFGENSWRLSPL
jgi:hypothetical protein